MHADQNRHALTSPQSTLAISRSISTTTPDLPTPALQWTNIGEELPYRRRRALMSARKSVGACTCGEFYTILTFNACMAYRILTQVVISGEMPLFLL